VRGERERGECLSVSSDREGCIRGRGASGQYDRATRAQLRPLTALCHGTKGKGQWRTGFCEGGGGKGAWRPKEGKPRTRTHAGEDAVLVGRYGVARYTYTRIGVVECRRARPPSKWT
jgi:hypothetical protein